jgi:hypothetical protein
VIARHRYSRDWDAFRSAQKRGASFDERCTQCGQRRRWQPRIACRYFIGGKWVAKRPACDPYSISETPLGSITVEYEIETRVPGASFRERALARVRRQAVVLREKADSLEEEASSLAQAIKPGR